MSYGRHPYYIMRNLDSDGVDGFDIVGMRGTVRVPYDAVAQLVASMEWRDRGNPSSTGLIECLKRGKELRPELA